MLFYLILFYFYRSCTLLTLREVDTKDKEGIIRWGEEAEFRKHIINNNNNINRKKKSTIQWTSEILALCCLASIVTYILFFYYKYH